MCQRLFNASILQNNIKMFHKLNTCIDSIHIFIAWHLLILIPFFFSPRFQEALNNHLSRECKYWDLFTKTSQTTHWHNIEVTILHDESLSLHLPVQSLMVERVMQYRTKIICKICWCIIRKFYKYYLCLFEKNKFLKTCVSHSNNIYSPFCSTLELED